jgi:hypothetical protein
MRTQTSRSAHGQRSAQRSFNTAHMQRRTMMSFRGGGGFRRR